MDGNEFPAQGLLDYLTRTDELMIKLIKTVENLQLVSQQQIVGVGAVPISTLIPQYLVDQKAKLESGVVIPYAIKAFSMDTAVTDYPVVIEGTNLVAACPGGSLDGCFVKFNAITNDASPLGSFDWEMPFYRIYLTWVAQGGKTLYLAIGRQAWAKGSTKALGGLASALTAELLYNAMPAASPVYSTLVDWRGAKRVIFHVTSTLDVACSLQVIGNINDATASATDINGALPMAVGNVTTQYLSVGLAWDDWHPYVGMRVTCAILPAAGTITIWAVQQE